MRKFCCFAQIREGDTAGIQHGGGDIVFCPIFAVTHQGIAPTGELNADLVASAGVEFDANKTFIALG